MDQHGLPVDDSIAIEDHRTIRKSSNWWRAVVLGDGHHGLEVSVYLWRNKNGSWKRKQKYTVRDQENWEKERKQIDELVDQLN